MGRLFNLENPVWRFIGNLADFFLLSVFVYLCCIPVVTAGSAFTALYYVTLKMASGQEGYTAPSFWRSFRLNFKQATVIWLVFLAAGMVLFADFYYSLTSGSFFAGALFFTFAIVGLLYVLCLFFMFPLLARCDNTVSALLKMCFAMCIRNFLPILAAVAVAAGVFSIGIFVFWPLLLVAPGLTAYMNSFLFNRILNKYDLRLP